MARKSGGGSGPGKPGSKWLRQVPQHVISFFENQTQLVAEQCGGNEHLINAARRLLVDERMGKQWEWLGRHYNATGGFVLRDEVWGEYFFWSAVIAYSHATRPRQWDLLTKAQQSRWHLKLQRLTAELAELFETAPCMPTVLPTIGKDQLIAYIESLGISVIHEHRATAPGEVHWAVVSGHRFSSPWTIVDSLTTLGQTVSDDEFQVLKKPGDSSAQRANFYLELTGSLVGLYDQPMQQLVATAADVMFDDGRQTDVRVVRRITTGK